MGYQEQIREYIELEKSVLDKLDADAIDQALELIVQTLDDESMIYIFGNGGSAVTASHFQNDFNKGLSEGMERKFKFCCLSDNMATVTAIANDIGYEEVYREQLRGRLKSRDICIAISGSGNSPNIINAVEYARELGVKVIGLSGYDGGRLKRLADVSIHVPVMSMQVTEDVHMIMDHLMMSVLYKSLCGISHIRQEGQT